MSAVKLATPEVYFAGGPVGKPGVQRFLDDIHATQWATDATRGEALAEVAGRVCYMSFANPRPGGSKEYLKHIKESGHGSVLEHAVYSLIIRGVSRSLSHELVRHRAGFSYSQLSQRYVDETDTRFIEPEIIRKDPECHERFMDAMAAANEAYAKIADRLYSLEPAQPTTPDGRKELRKKVRQAARSVLPNATETILFVTANARAWRNFLDQRATIHAEAEICAVAILIFHVLQSEAPELFGDYEEVVENGRTVLKTSYRKV